MSVGPGAAGLRWLWAVVAELGPGESADEGEGCPGIVEEPVVARRGREGLSRPGDPGPGPVRPGQRCSLRVHGDQLVPAPQ
jgi:hypothetical protein